MFAEIGQALLATIDLPDALNRALHVLTARLERVFRTSVVLHDEADITVDVRRSDRDRASEPLRSLSAPIILDGRAVGTLRADVAATSESDGVHLFSVLQTAGLLIAQAVGAHRLFREAHEEVTQENARLRQELTERYDFPNLIGESGPMRQLYARVVDAATARSAVLLRGETGTGKNLIAHVIHYHSTRAQGPFVTLNALGLPAHLIDAELLGHEPGVLAGGVKMHGGRLESASGGTLYVDDVAALGLSAQERLLCVIEGRGIDRLGGVEPRLADVRVLAATSRDLERAVKSGEFRQDLYSRLGERVIFVPALRQRKSDVLLLAEHFLEGFAETNGRRVRRIAAPAVDLLVAYDWPGNVRELRSAIERAVALCDGDVFHAHHLPATLQPPDPHGDGDAASFRASMESFEKDALITALKRSRGNRARAARLLSTTERIFNYRVRKYRIDWRRFKR